MVLIPTVFDVHTYSFTKRLLIVFALPIWYAISAIYSYIINNWLLKTKLIALGSCTGLVLLLMSIHKPLYPILDKVSHSETEVIKWSGVLSSISLAALIQIIQLVTY
ncbi:MAG: hypothetical protein H7645_02010 [Candidatus Heimdallarchaeota archaeon]|nr:hypothetical protein [Candidatus Heimdallarchaeota archaeon]MCK4769093.1 hypothetical protein [Candidatus Heimdallarchaeota archaeon]